MYKLKKEILRETKCTYCKNAEYISYGTQKIFCSLLKQEVPCAEARYCHSFVAMLKKSSKDVSDEGYEYRSKKTEDYRTAKQWEKAGYRVKESEKGKKMHASMSSYKVAVYYLPQQVEAAVS